MRKDYLSNVLRFLPLVGLAIMTLLFLVYWKYFGIELQLPKMSSSLQWYYPVNPEFRFPFAMSSMVLVTFMLFMIGISINDIYLCGGKLKMKLYCYVLGLLSLFYFFYTNCLKGNLSFTHFPENCEGIMYMLDVSNVLLAIMLLSIAFSQSLLPLPYSKWDLDTQKGRVRMYNVQIYVASLILAVGLLEVFLLYQWWFGYREAQMVVLGAGLVYSGLMIILFMPPALLLHRSALVHQTVLPPRPNRRFIQSKSANHRSLPKDNELSLLSPVTGFGHYVAALLPALLGILPSLLG